MGDKDATLMGYLDSWNDCFVGQESKEGETDRLRNRASNGQLRGCKFRSVCWRVFLNCIPRDTNQWESVVTESREKYEKIRNEHIVIPQTCGEKQDLNVENPLSQSDRSSWNKFFKNMELRKTIERDVSRTFPEMKYFHDDKVHMLLIDILFCYACEHSQLSYRQGMHELLAPLVFVLHCDLQAAASARERGQVTDLINLMLDEDYLEHDSYEMFCSLMESTNKWYSVALLETNNTDHSDGEDNDVEPKLFRKQSINSTRTLAIAQKLNHIYNTLLVKYDLQLHTHLNSLEIIPQVFGLRWIRLLFGREFSLQDILVLWDAIFADSATLDLVDYLFVAMLIHIRRQLLSSDYTTCLQLLMKYPPVDDINDIVSEAKNIREGHGQSENQVPPVPSRKASTNVKLPTSPSGNANKENPILKAVKEISRKVISDSRPSLNVQNHLKDPTFAGQVRTRPHILAAGEARFRHNQPRFVQRYQSPAIYSMKTQEVMRMNSLENQVRALRTEIDQKNQKCQYCSNKIDACITFLQSTALSQAAIRDDTEGKAARPSTSELEQENYEKEQILFTVASLKQVRDLLKGTVDFTPSLPEYSFPTQPKT